MERCFQLCFKLSRPPARATFSLEPLLVNRLDLKVPTFRPVTTLMSCTPPIYGALNQRFAAFSTL